MLIVREDDVVISGTVQSGWMDTDLPTGTAAYQWTLLVKVDAASAPRLVTAGGVTNPFGWLPCAVTPPAPYRSDPIRSGLVGAIIGQKVRISGTWCDATDANGVVQGTTIQPITWIVVDRGVSVIVEEHGFTQAIQDADVFAFSDDTILDPLAPAVIPHHGEDRHVDVSIPFPARPQSNAVPVCAECDDRELAEAIFYDYVQKNLPKAFPLHSERLLIYAIEPGPTSDALRIQVDTGTPAAGQGFFYAKLALTYKEPFDKMCLPDVCLVDPGSSCQFTGEFRHAYAWPRLDPALAGDLLLGPAGGKGVLGQLLGALQPVQRFDHMALFVDHGRTLRHCTDSDDRTAEKVYYNGSVKIDYTFGSTEIKIPLAGLLGDILRFGWPGSITQSLGEVGITGRNRLNDDFSFASQYAGFVATEPTTVTLAAPAGASVPAALWQLAPGERDKRTAFHDPEATATARRDKNAGERLRYSLARLQTVPAFRSDVGILWPKLVKPQPVLEPSARPALLEVAHQALLAHAHYGFFGYSKSEIATDPAFLAPPKGDPSWRGEGADWAAGTIPAMCSSFVWAACQAANVALAAAGKPVIVLEQEQDPTDARPPAEKDGLYRYQAGERVDAGKALFQFTHNKVTDQVDAMIHDLDGPESLLVSAVNLGGTVDDMKNALATIVANQLCNVFASGNVSDLGPTWQNPGTGSAVSPDDTFANWDVNVDPSDLNPPLPGPGRVNVYGNAMAVAVPNPTWINEPIYLVSPVVGTGEVHGLVVRRVHEGEQPIRVLGATVRLGCQATTSGLEGYNFAPTKSGRYLLYASMFIIDRDNNVGVEWKSKQVDITIHNGDVLTGVDLELFPPPGIARNLVVEHHADMVDRKVIGKDDWGHFDLNETLPLAFDPREDPTLPQNQRNTRLTATYDQTTPAVGDTHVHVTVDATLHSEPGAGGSVHFDGSVDFDVHLVFYEDGETFNTIDDPGHRLFPTDPPFTLPYNLVDWDISPDRASGEVTVRNILGTLLS